MTESTDGTNSEPTRDPFRSSHYFYDESGNDWGWFYDSAFEIAQVTDEEEEKA